MANKFTSTFNGRHNILAPPINPVRNPFPAGIFKVNNNSGGFGAINLPPAPQPLSNQNNMLFGGGLFGGAGGGAPFGGAGVVQPLGLGRGQIEKIEKIYNCVI